MSLLLVMLSLPLAGCSGASFEGANNQVDEANEAINEHNRLFEEARATYEEAKEAVESGDDPSAEAERIQEARESMAEARDNLREARESLARVQDQDVAPEAKEYAGLLSNAMETQIAAEDREVDFYELLEEDPTLEDNRDEALEILAEVDQGYRSAEDTYARARELADANPEIIR